jgi:hypothetical protein
VVAVVVVAAGPTAVSWATLPPSLWFPLSMLAMAGQQQFQQVDISTSAQAQNLKKHGGRLGTRRTPLVGLRCAESIMAANSTLTGDSRLGAEP